MIQARLTLPPYRYINLSVRVDFHISGSSCSTSIDKTRSNSFNAGFTELDQSNEAGNGANEQELFPGFHAVSSTESIRPPYSCRCMRSQADKLCLLKSIEQRQVPVKFDVILSWSKTIAQASEDQLQCAFCRSDSHTLLLTVMTFQVIFRWVRSQIHPTDIPSEDLNIKMGQYEISKQEACVLKSVLVQRAFDKNQKVLMLLRARVEQVAKEMERIQLWDFERVEIRNLQALCQSLMQTSAMDAKRIRQKTS